MIDFFPAGTAFIWAPNRDGGGYHISPNDPGKATDLGVTYAIWSAWEHLHGRVPTLAAFRKCGRPDFLPLYRTQYWNAACCDRLGAIGIQIFDAAVLSGPGNAAHFLQHVLNALGFDVTEGNGIDGRTLGAFARTDPAALNYALTNERERFYAKLPTAKYFERGWDARAEACRDLVASLLSREPRQPTWAPSNKPPVAPATADAADDLNAKVLAGTFTAGPGGSPAQ